MQLDASSDEYDSRSSDSSREWVMVVYCKHNISCQHKKKIFYAIGCLSSGSVTQFTNSHDSYGFGHADQYLWSWTSLTLSASESDVIKAGDALSTANGTLTLWIFPKDISFSSEAKLHFKSRDNS